MNRAKGRHKAAGVRWRVCQPNQPQSNPTNNRTHARADKQMQRKKEPIIISSFIVHT